MMPQEIEPAVEAALLRGVFDNQPVCVLRVRIDGVVLSATDAALAFVGAEGLGAIVGQAFAEWVVRDHHIAWRTFLHQVCDGAAASLQCDLLAPGGGRETVLLHGVPLVEHPDGVPSIAVAIRSSDSPYIVSNGHDHQASTAQPMAEPAAPSSTDDTERQRLEAMVRNLENRLQYLTSEYEAVRSGRAAQTMSPQASGANQRQVPPVFDELQILNAVRETTVWRQLEASIAEREAVLAQLESDLTRTRAELERAKDESQHLAAEWAADRAKLDALVEEGKNGSSQPSVATEDAVSNTNQTLLEQAIADREATQAELERVIADRDRLTEIVQTVEANRHSLVAEHVVEIQRLQERLNTLSTARANQEAAAKPDRALLSQLQASLAEREETASQLVRELTEARNALEQSHAERRRLEALVREGEGQPSKGIFQTILKGPALEVARTKAELSRILAERLRLASALRSADAQQQRLAAARAADRAEFDRKLQAIAVEQETQRAATEQAREEEQAQAARHRQLLQERDREVALVRAALEQALAERQRLEASVADLETRERQLVATSNAERADVDQLFDALVVEHQAELRRAKEAHEVELTNVRKDIRDEHSQLVQQLEGERAARQGAEIQATADREHLESRARDLELRVRQFEARTNDLERSFEQVNSERLADRTALEQAHAEKRRLEGAVLELQAALLERETAQANERTAFEGRFTSLVTEHRIALEAAREASDERERNAAREREALLTKADLELRARSAVLDQAQAEHRRLSESLRRVEITAQESEAARASAHSRLEDAAAATERLEADVRKLKAERADLETLHGTERADFKRRLETQAADHEEKLRAAHRVIEQRDREAEAAYQSQQRQFEAELALARGELDQARAERQQIQATVMDLEATLRRDKTAHAADRAALEQRLERLVGEHDLQLRAARQAAEAREREATLQRDTLQEQFEAERGAARTALDRALADARDKAAALSDLEDRYAGLEASFADDRAKFERQIDTMVARHQLELATAEEGARHRDEDVARQHAQALMQLEAQLVSTRAELERALADRQRFGTELEELKARQNRIAEFRSEEHSRLQQLEQELASERRAAHAREQDAAANAVAHQAHLSRVANIEAERARLARAVADYEITMQALAENARRLAPFAAAGRVALEVGTQLRDLIEDVDLRSARILAQCDLDSPERGDLERLRARAIAVAALAHEILDSSAESADGHAHPLGRARVRRSVSRR
jgi:hypothetical protein